MGRVFNFSAGPSVLPEEVLKIAGNEMMDWHGSGMSVMEMSHRSKWYDGIIKQAEADLRDLMDIPSNYKVLFLQGGAYTQFAMVPMNLMKKGKADYVNTGAWSKKAQRPKIGKVNVIASSEDLRYIYSELDPNIQQGCRLFSYYNQQYNLWTRYTKLPETKFAGADMSSIFCLRNMMYRNWSDICRSSKNMGPQGCGYYP